MATKKKSSKKPSTRRNSTSDAHVTRIRAGESNKPKRTAAKKPRVHRLSSSERADKATASHLKPSSDAPSAREVAQQKAEKSGSTRTNPLTAIVNYFKGAWYELRQVRWPDRTATWSMTGALIGFTIFFLAVVILLDALFKYLFELILS